MTNIRVVATVTYDFDTEDGLVTTKEEALQQVREFINEGEAGAREFEFEVTETPIAHATITASQDVKHDACPQCRQTSNHSPTCGLRWTWEF